MKRFQFIQTPKHVINCLHGQNTCSEQMESWGDFNQPEGIVSITDNLYHEAAGQSISPYWKRSLFGISIIQENIYCESGDFYRTIHVSLIKSINLNWYSYVLPNLDILKKVLGHYPLSALCIFFKRVPSWLWRLQCSLLLSCGVYFTLIPWATQQRGYPALGGEYFIMLIVSALPFCIYR